MTVIAFDGRTLAADKRATTGGGMVRTITKIERHNGELLAVTGGLDIGLEMKEWYKAGADPERFPEVARKDDAVLIVIKNRRIYSYASGPYPMEIEARKCAFGSGRDFAEAAMYLGRTAVEAVEIASLFQSDCGNGVDSFDLW